MLGNMRVVSASCAALGLLLASGASAAVPESRLSAPGPQSARYVPADSMEDEALPYLQCVPYARQVSGIQIYGDAWTWWDQAEGLYNRGNRPKRGAVMSFQPYGNMRLGHVAAVSKVIDSRTVLLRHANWSPIDGRRGQIEDDVRAIDVSPNNDWSAVRVWFAPLGKLGTTAWPLNGFIYPEMVRSKAAPTVLASANTGKATTVRPAAPKPQQPASRPILNRPVQLASADLPKNSRIGSDFLSGIRLEAPVSRKLINNAPPQKPASVKAKAPEKVAVRQAATPATAPVTAKTAPPAATRAPALRPDQYASSTTSRAPKAPQRNGTARSDDPIGRIIASRSR